MRFEGHRKGKRGKKTKLVYGQSFEFLDKFWTQKSIGTFLEEPFLLSKEENPFPLTIFFLSFCCFSPPIKATVDFSPPTPTSDELQLTVKNIFDQPVARF